MLFGGSKPVRVGGFLFIKQQQEISIMLQISHLKEFTKGPILSLLESYKKLGLTGLVLGIYKRISI